MSVEELIGRLRSAEKRCSVGGAEGSGSQLLLTEEEWIACGRRKELGTGSGPSSGGGKGKGRGKPQNGKGNGDRDMSQVKCFNCNKYAGHFSRDCKEPRRERKGQQQQSRAQAHLVQAGNEEPAALLARACTLSDDDGPSLLIATAAEKQLLMARVDAPTTILNSERVHIELVEEHVYFANEPRRDDTWFLDTGASNHMSGHLSVFSELDTSVTGTVKFGDGSLVEI